MRAKRRVAPAIRHAPCFRSRTGRRAPIAPGYRRGDSGGVCDEQRRKPRTLRSPLRMRASGGGWSLARVRLGGRSLVERRPPGAGRTPLNLWDASRRAQPARPRRLLGLVARPPATFGARSHRTRIRADRVRAARRLWRWAFGHPWFSLSRRAGLLVEFTPGLDGALSSAGWRHVAADHRALFPFPGACARQITGVDRANGHGLLLGSFTWAPHRRPGRPRNTVDDRALRRRVPIGDGGAYTLDREPSIGRRTRSASRGGRASRRSGSFSCSTFGHELANVRRSRRRDLEPYRNRAAAGGRSSARDTVLARAWRIPRNGTVAPAAIDGCPAAVPSNGASRPRDVSPRCNHPFFQETPPSTLCVGVPEAALRSNVTEGRISHARTSCIRRRVAGVRRAGGKAKFLAAISPLREAPSTTRPFHPGAAPSRASGSR
jgi:hypothetical protein